MCKEKHDTTVEEMRDELQQKEMELRRVTEEAEDLLHQRSDLYQAVTAAQQAKNKAVQDLAAMKSDLGVFIMSSHDDYRLPFEEEFKEVFHRLWRYFLDLQAKQGDDCATLHVEICLEVCAAFDPEMSSAGISELLSSLGMLQNGRISETLFHQWMAIMFAGCSEDALEEGIASLLDAVSVVHRDCSLVHLPLEDAESNDQESIDNSEG